MSGLDFDRIRRRKRGYPTGREIGGMPLVICPSWEEVQKLEGQGVLPVHVDEAETMARSTLLTAADKRFILDLKKATHGVRLLKIIENKNGQEKDRTDS